MRASIRGGGGDTGKCTIEVEVDGTAEVEVRGDSGRIRTLQGQPSTWRRFECTSPLPTNPANFRFKGIDGRGNVNLVRDPNSTRGTAVVQINDSQGGREGYTFDLLWQGNGGYYDDRRYDPSYGRNDPYNRRNDPYYGDDRYSRNRSGNDWGYGNNSAQSVGMCQDAVRSRARRDYGVRSIDFNSTNVGEGRGYRDRVTGWFDDNRGSRYEYSCAVNPNNGSINSVDIRRR